MALQAAKSTVRLDVDNGVPVRMELAPRSILEGQTHDGKIFHYRDSRNMEIDAFEVKMGFNAQDEAAANLLNFAKKIDQVKMGKPAALTVITANGFACRRKDGVNVVPLQVLTA